MKRGQDTACIPQGFLTAGTYSGLCDTRVKLDVAAFVSPANCSILISDTAGCRQYTGKAVLLHNGMALPQNARGQEIKTEVCQAIAAHMHLSVTDVVFAAQGIQGQFRPSRLINSLETLTAALASSHIDQVGAVLDNTGDLTYCTIPAGNQSMLCGMAADGTREKDGLSVILTDADVTPQQWQEAIEQCRQTIDLEEFTLICMANGAAKKPMSALQLADAVQNLCRQLGFQVSLQACS